jgi:hypothetical protein
MKLVSNRNCRLPATDPLSAHLDAFRIADDSGATRDFNSWFASLSSRSRSYKGTPCCAMYSSMDRSGPM